MSATSTLTCPHCGKRYSLTEDYLAKHGGGEIACTKCGGGIVLPMASGADVMEYANPRAVRQSIRQSSGAVSEANFVCPFCQKMFLLTRDYVRDYQGQEITCDGCSKAVAVPDVFDPQPATGDDRIGPDGRALRCWRDEDVLVMEIGAHAPDWCLRCGEAVTVPHTPMTLTWNPKPMYRQGALLNEVVGARKATVELGLCARHRRLRATYFWLSILLVVLGIAGMIVGVVVVNLLTIVAGAFLGFSAGVTTYFSMLNQATACYIDQRVVKLHVHADCVKHAPLRRLERQAVQSRETAAFDQIQ